MAALSIYFMSICELQENIMAKGQMRSNREVRKAKQVKPSTVTVSASLYKPGPGMSERNRSAAQEAAPATKSKP